MAKMYFAYGSNLSQEQMLERCPGAKPLRGAKLDGHRLAFVGRVANRGHGGVATIIPQSGAYTLGGVYSMTDADWQELDSIEGIRSGNYERKSVRLVDGTLADTYVALKHRKGGFHPPSGAYLSIIKRGYRDFDLSDKFIKTIRPLEDASDHVFVYGSLMQPYHNHRLLRDSYLTVVEGDTNGYLKYTSGIPDEELAQMAPGALERFDQRYGYPIMFRGGETRVYGELYRLRDEKGDHGKVATLKRLDMLEGVSGSPSLQGYMYQRTIVPVVSDGRVVWAWAYTQTQLPARWTEERRPQVHPRRPQRSTEELLKEIGMDETYFKDRGFRWQSAADKQDEDDGFYRGNPDNRLR